ncbi:MAG: Rab family GTPase [Candidatus Heimdallarchaeota archaeon]
MGDHQRQNYKVLMLGDAGVGKTALVRRFAHSIFDENYKATLGVDMVPRIIRSARHKVEALLQLWDFSGQALFGRLRARFYAGATGALLVYDVTQDRSFDRLERWLDELTVNVGRIPTLVVGNKMDLALLRQITDSEGNTFASTLNTSHFSTSAKTGENVDLVFAELADGMMADLS